MISDNESVSSSDSDDEDKIVNILQFKEEITKHGIIQTLMEHVYEIDDSLLDQKIHILLTTECFDWLYKMIKSGHSVTKFKTAQSFIYNNDFNHKIWNKLILHAILFVECVYYPSILRKCMNDMQLFERFMIIFHWVFDYWFHIKNFKPIEKHNFLPSLSSFLFFRLTKIQAVYSHLLNFKHLIIYSQNKKYFKRYILDVLTALFCVMFAHKIVNNKLKNRLTFESRYNPDDKKNKFKMTKKNISNLRMFSNEFTNMKPSFRILGIKCLRLYFKKQHSIASLKPLKKFISFGDLFLGKVDDSPVTFPIDKITLEKWDKISLFKSRYVN